MKKVTFLAAIAALSGLASCTAQSPKANLTDELDSLSYSIGMANSQGLKEYLVGRMDVDTTYINEFIKGLNEATSKESKKDIAYFAGIQIGQQLNMMTKGINQELFQGDSTKTINKDNFIAGFIAGTLEKGGLMTVEQAQGYTERAMEEIKTKALERSLVRTRLQVRSSSPRTRRRRVYRLFLADFSTRLSLRVRVPSQLQLLRLRLTTRVLLSTVQSSTAHTAATSLLLSA
jgi:hypothetical protein